jgi:hypothetical protein
MMWGLCRGMEGKGGSRDALALPLTFDLLVNRAAARLLPLRYEIEHRSLFDGSMVFPL